MAINWEEYYRAVLNNPTARQESVQKAEEVLGTKREATPTVQAPTATAAPTQGTYTVKPGDTLSQIAKSLGLPGHQSLTGYRSGNPNLIFPGEQLTYQTAGGFQDAYSQAQRPTAQSITEQFPERATGIREEYQNAQAQRDQARQSLENARTNMFNQEYESMGLGQTKERIAQIDESITDLRQQRDDAILQTKRNPNVSAGVLAGEVGKITDYFNQTINNEIGKRNAVSEEYNRGLDEIDKKVMNNLQDLAMQYDHWNTIASEMERNMHRYEDILREQLREGTMDERWQKEFDRSMSEFEKKLAQGYASINKPTAESDIKLQSVERKNELGKPTGVVDWYNPYTGELVHTSGK